MLTGINILHVRMQRADDGLPRFFVLDGSIRHPRDEMLEGKPSGFAEEVPDYVWKPVDDTLAQNKNAPEEPMKLQDHSLDGVRYLCRWAHQRNYTTPASETGWKGTWRDYITHYKMDPA